jgi:putative selenium metabolism protein SsnA
LVGAEAQKQEGLMLISNAKVVTWGDPRQILEDYAVFIDDGLVADLGPSNELKERYPQAEQLDAGSQYLLPGNICAHTHFYGAFARGMAIPGRPPEDFPAILRRLWWPLDKSLTEQDVRYSALVSLVDAVKHGTTSLIDHHVSPNVIDGSLDILTEAVEQSGLRAVLCYEVTDRDGIQKAEAGIAENVRFIGRCHQGEVAKGRVAGAFGLHASLTLSDHTLDNARQASGDAQFHIHVAEHQADEYDSLSKSGLRVVDRLAQHGILDTAAIIAHGVHIDAAEVNILARQNAWLSHQPRSNMNNGVGVAQVESMLRAGVRVCLGNDGFSNTMWMEWKTAYLLHKAWHRDPRRMGAETIIELAVKNNAKLAGGFFPTAPLGVIAIGAHADIILVDYHPTTPLTAGNIAWHILFGFHESMVTTTIVGGQILMKDRVLITLDEEQITARSRELAVEVWKRYESLAPEV